MPKWLKEQLELAVAKVKAKQLSMHIKLQECTVSPVKELDLLTVQNYPNRAILQKV